MIIFKKISVGARIEHEPSAEQLFYAVMNVSMTKTAAPKPCKKQHLILTF